MAYQLGCRKFKPAIVFNLIPKKMCGDKIDNGQRKIGTNLNGGNTASHGYKKQVDQSKAQPTKNL